jgi:ABC-type uncharacterized transport system substrate-binding protein
LLRRFAPRNDGKGRVQLLQKSAIGRLLGLLLVATAGLALGLSSAAAHPHVWITAKSQVMYAPDGSVSGVRHAWTFDDMFSTYALQGIEQKTKGAYSREELAPLAQTNVESLKEFSFFTFARADGTRQRFLEPVDYFLDYKDSLLTLHFTLPAKTPFRAKQLVLEVFDKTFFIDFQYAEKDPVTLVGAPADCRMQFQRPNDGSAAAQKLGEQNFLSGEGGNFGMMFANKITVDCP